MPSQRSYPDESTQRGAPDFEVLVELHYAALYRFAMSLTRTEHEAADLVQETFLAWAGKTTQLRDAGKAKPWLFTTLHRLFLRGRQRLQRFPEIEIMEAEPELPVVELDLPGWLDALDMTALLSRLDETFRAPVALFYLEDCSLAEIAVILEAPLGTVKSRISRGLERLRALAAVPAQTRPQEEAP